MKRALQASGPMPGAAVGVRTSTRGSVRTTAGAPASAIPAKYSARNPGSGVPGTATTSAGIGVPRTSLLETRMVTPGPRRS